MGRRDQPSTQEIPIVQPASPAPRDPGGAPAAAPVPQLPPLPGAPAFAQPTGPVDFVPGLPGAGILPPPPPVAARRPRPLPRPGRAPRRRPRPRADGRGGAGLAGQPGSGARLLPRSGACPPGPPTGAPSLGLGLAALAVVLLEVGLLLGFGTESLWSAVPLWSAFATVSASLSACWRSPPSTRRATG